jgi:hypothetical protein
MPTADELPTWTLGASVWAWLKYDRLTNFAPRDAQHLNEAVNRELGAIREDQERLRNFFHPSGLPLPRALLT